MNRNDLHATVDRRLFLHGITATGAIGLLASPIAAKPAATSKTPLHFHTREPANNAEPDLSDLVKNWITPNELFYIRSHAPVPEVDLNEFRLTVEGMVHKELSLSAAQLNEMANADVLATLTCAGNRRTEYNATRQIDGVPWNEGAIGNARWGGVKLSTLLRQAGVKDSAKHVWFESIDEIKKGGTVFPFGGSIPIQKAMSDDPAAPGAMIATTMNGEPLPPDHGYPARAVVPGYIGARSVKWLGRIVVSDHPSLNYYQQGAYKLVENAEKLTMAEASPLYRNVMNSAICTPESGAKLKPGKVQLSGYALPTGDQGATISRVEISTNGGRRWQVASLQKESRPYCWRLWQAEAEIDALSRQLMVRAFDSNGKCQPASVPWNAKGYMFNAWHRVPISVAD